MAETDVFQRMISTSDVETAYVTYLKKWLPTYLAQVERDHGVEVGKIPRPASYQLSYDFDNWPEQHLPAVIVVCSGWNEMERHGSTFSAWFDVGVAIVVKAGDENRTRRNAQWYATAVLNALINRPTLDGFAEATYPQDENSGLPANDNRTLQTSVVTFRTLVGNVATAGSGPTSPDPQLDPNAPYPPLSTVESTSLDGVESLTDTSP